MLANSSVKCTAERVYSALHDPVTIHDRYEAARHSSKRFWDVALLGGPRLVRHGGRDLHALKSDEARKQLLSGVALSAVGVLFLPITGVVSGIHGWLNPRELASTQFSFVYRLKTAVAAHSRDVDRQRGLTDRERESELLFGYDAVQKIEADSRHRVKNSNSLIAQIEIWHHLVKLMPRVALATQSNCV